MREIDEVAVRLAHVRFHAAQAEDHFAVAFGREIFGGVQRLVQRDAETALDQHRKFLLSSDQLQELEVLRVARADLKHDARRIAGFSERIANFVDVGLMGHFHRDDLDAVFARELEDIGQAFRAEALERVGRGARLVCAHARANLTMRRERFHHRLDRLRGIDGAESGKHVKRVLSEVHAVVIERRWTIVALFMAAQHAIRFGDAHDLRDAWQHLHLLDR
jgi:hypothetical protein